MILLLLTSALALSFVPLKSNALSAITVTIGTVAYDPATKKLTVPVTASAAVTAGNAFELALFETIDGEDEVIARVDIEDKLDGTEKNAEATLDLATVKVDLEAIYIDVIETETDGDDVTKRSMLAARIAVGFAKLDEVTSTATATEATFTITLDKDLTDPLTDTKFVFNEEEIDVAAVESETKKCTVTLTKEKLLAASSTTGYIKGTDLITTTLPFSLFAKPDFTLEHVDATKTHATANEATAPAKVWFVNDGTAAELTKVTGQEYYEILYTKLNDAVVYYTDENGIMTSNKLDITLPACAAPTDAEYVKGESAADAPGVKLIFAAALPNRKLVMTSTPAADAVDVSEKEPEVPLETFVGTAGYYIALEGTEPKSLPSAALTAAELTVAPGAKDEDGNIPVTVTIDEIGFIAAKPAGIVVRVSGATDYAGAKYYGFSWSEVEGAENEGTAKIPLAAWKASKDKEIHAFVSQDYSEAIPVEPKKLTTEAKAIDALITTFVTVEGAAFTPADLKLKVTIKSTADVSATAQGEYRIAGFDKAEEGNELFEEPFTKAELSGGNKDVTATLVLGEAYADLKNIYVDVFETLTDKDEESMVKPERKKVTFAAKEAIAVEKDGDDLKFTITLDSDLATPLTDVKFVFDGEDLTVAAVTGETKKFTVTIPLADVRDAESKLGYVKGKDLATSTLPFSVVPPTPAPVLGLLSATHAKCVLADAPEGMKVMLKSGTADAKEMTKEEGEAFFRIAYADLKAVCKVYYAIGDDKFGEEATITALAALDAPSAEALVAVADKLPSLKVTFGAAVQKRKLVLVQEEGEPVLVDVSAEDDTVITSDKLVGTDGYYIVTEDGKIPLSEGKALAAATFTQTKAAAAEGKIPVTVEMTKGFYAAEPKGLLVHAKGEDDKTKMKFYALTWGTTAETVNKATAQVTVDDFKTITDKDIESYVCPDYSEAIPDEPVKISEAFVVIAKTEPVEPEPKDEGAFGQMVSLMAVVVSLFVLAL